MVALLESYVPKNEPPVKKCVGDFFVSRGDFVGEKSSQVLDRVGEITFIYETLRWSPPLSQNRETHNGDNVYVMPTFVVTTDTKTGETSSHIEGEGYFVDGTPAGFSDFSAPTKSSFSSTHWRGERNKRSMRKFRRTAGKVGRKIRGPATAVSGAGIFIAGAAFETTGIGAPLGVYLMFHGGTQFGLGLTMTGNDWFNNSRAYVPGGVYENVGHMTGNEKYRSMGAAVDTVISYSTIRPTRSGAISITSETLNTIGE